MLAALRTVRAALHLHPRPHLHERSTARAFARQVDGATMVEYALMLTFVAVVVLAAVESTGIGARDVFATASDAFGIDGGGGGGGGGGNGGGGNGGGNGEGGGNGGCGTQCGQ